MGHDRDYLDRLHRWLETAASAAHDEFDLGGLEEEGLSIVGTDLADMMEAAESLRRRLGSLVEAEPSGDTLEDALMEVEADLAHASWHWRSIVKRLRAKGLWFDDDLELGDCRDNSGPE